jgi:hypothetical protein
VHHGALAPGLLDLPQQLGALRLRDDRPHLCRWIEGITHHQCVHGLGETSQKFVCHRLDHDEALGCDARLPVVLDPGRHRRPHRVVQIGRGQDDERIRAAKLENALLQGMSRAGRYGHAGLLTPGQGDGRNPGVLYERRDVLALDEEVGECTRGQACSSKDVL